jgi:YidC/Oxa1 family membrane protein insertase
MNQMDSRNLIMAVVFSVVIMVGFQWYMDATAPPPDPATKAATEAKKGTSKAGSPALPEADLPVPVPEAAQAEAAKAQPEAEADTGPRVRIESPRLRGSLALKGARLDDLILVDYRETVEPDSAQIRLLHRQGTKNPYYAEFGWVSADIKTPGLDTVWSASTDTLRAGKENRVTLQWDNGEGVVFHLVYEIDENYMFTVTQRVENKGTQSATVFPFGRLSRTGTPDTLGFYILHEGLLGVFDGVLKEVDYDDLQETKTIKQTTTGGWIGITDKYWLTALIPDQGSQATTRFTDQVVQGTDTYRVDFRGAGQTVLPGATSGVESRLFAGAKEAPLIFDYRDKLGITNFDLTIDWGWFPWLTKPIFQALIYFTDEFLHNMGLSILLLTVLIKLAFFPLANKSYKAMTKMKALQPEMVKIRERFSEDKTRMNQEVMGLYKREKVNPAAGCLPILPQIPVFFALYKVLFVTIEMRHAPFFGWIEDLSAPDPLGLLTVFGLIQWDVPELLQILNIGIWPLLMGGSMFLQQKLNPPPADPTQAKIFMFLPIMFTFMLARFPSGLVIYWAWNNTLSILQQYTIMKRAGVPIGGGQIKKPAPAAAAAAPNPGAQPNPGGQKSAGQKSARQKNASQKNASQKSGGQRSGGRKSGGGKSGGRKRGGRKGGARS